MSNVFQKNSVFIHQVLRIVILLKKQEQQENFIPALVFGVEERVFYA